MGGFNHMGRTRKYADQAEKQRAYRERIDISGDLLQLRADLQRLAADGCTVTIDPVRIDFSANNSREVLRQVVQQVRRVQQ
jgi:hypothetical protein